MNILPDSSKCTHTWKVWIWELQFVLTHLFPQQEICSIWPTVARSSDKDRYCVITSGETISENTTSETQTNDNREKLYQHHVSSENNFPFTDLEIWGYRVHRLFVVCCKGWSTASATDIESIQIPTRTTKLSSYFIFSERSKNSWIHCRNVPGIIEPEATF
mgnify:CR=1 FL=1